MRIHLPTVEQPDGFTCGVASLMSICSYYGVGEKTFKAFKKKVHANPADGTYYRDMIGYADRLGLDACCVPGMTGQQLEEYIRAGRPVICSIQAYGNPKDYVRNDKDNGHYVVAIGFDKLNYYFMDPSVPAAHRRRGFLPKAEFVKRWHEDEAKKGEKSEVFNHLGIVVYPRKGHTAFLLHAMKIP